MKVWCPEGALSLGVSGVFQSRMERISPSPPGLLQTPVHGCVCHPLGAAGFLSTQPAEGPREMQAAMSFLGSCRLSGLDERSWRGAHPGGP